MGSNYASELIYWTVIAGILVLCVFGIFQLYKRKNPKKRVQKWLGISILSLLILVILFTNELLPGAKMYYDYKFTVQIVGRGISLDEIYSYESYRDPLLGDGYSLYLYEMDEKSSDYFRHPDENFFTSFPFVHAEKRPGELNWTKTPIDSADIEVNEFALGEGHNLEPRKMNELGKVQRSVSQMLDKQGAYYAYRANYLGSNVWNVSFYVLSPKEKRFVEVYNDL